MAIRIFIDGAAGTTGLEIRDRLQSRRDVELAALADRNRKDLAARKAALNEAAIVILCLPDAAAREAVALIENPEVREFLDRYALWGSLRVSLGPTR